MSHIFARCIIAATLGVTAFGVAAQGWTPTKPVRLVVTYPPGGSSDLMARAFAQELSGLLGQQVIIESKPGAAGSIGTEYAAKQAPDGYTFLVGNMQPLSVNPIMSKVQYDVARDLAPVSMLAIGPNILVVNANAPWKTLGELLAAMKAKPGTFNYGNSGPGALNHLAGELMKRTMGVEMTPVPYKGGVLAIQDLLGNQVQLVISDALPAMGHIRAGKLRPLAITTEKRSPLLPDVPTFAEGGVPGMVADNWWGILLPAGTPKPIIDRYNTEIAKALQTASVKEKFTQLGIEGVASTPEKLRDFIQSEAVRWGKVIKDGNIKVD